MKDLSEAILHCEEKAKELYRKADKDFYFDGDWGKRYHCIECAKEHEQLASWLKELAEYQKLFESPEEANELLDQIGGL